jgi:phenylacetate-CoA ligase
VRRAYAESRFYKVLFDRIGFEPYSDFDFGDYSRLPVLDRETVHGAGREMVSTALPESLLKRDATGGSTGAPTEIWMGPEERGWRESSTESFMRRIGAPAGVRTGFFWGHHLDPVKSDGLRDRWYNFANNIRWFDCFRLSSEILARYHAAFTRWRPHCLVAYAGALGQLAEFILEGGQRANYPTRCLVTGAEKLLLRHRAMIESAFQLPVHERYGGRDTGCIAFQLEPARSRDFEVDWANLFVEPESEKRYSPILITKLHGDGMPMLRYRIGDLGQFPAGSRPGHPVFELAEVLGREVDRIWLPNGHWLHGAQMPHLLRDYPVREFMFRQTRDYSVELNIVPGEGFGDESFRGIISTVAANLPGLEFSLRIRDTIPRTQSNKYRPVVSYVRPPKQRRALS